MTCSEEGCSQPTRAKGLCSRHYFAAYDRRRGKSGTGGHHRPPLDGEVYKVRFRRHSGSTHTIYYSDPKLAEATALRYADSGQLLFFGRYAFAEQLVSS